MTVQREKQLQGKLAGQATAENTQIFRHTAGMANRFKSHMDFHFTRVLSTQIYGGSATGECYEAASRVIDGNFESYSQAWLTTAKRLEAKAWACLGDGHKVSARDTFLRAMVYWGAVSMYTSETNPLTKESMQHARSMFKEFAKLSDSLIEPVDIPYENGRTMKGYFLRAGAPGEKRRTIVGMGGGENFCEESYFHFAAGAVRRGYNALMFEVPGQKAAVWENPGLYWRFDAEVPIRYVIDYALTRPEVDPERIALIGHSVGGYYVTRAACFEKRLAAVIASPIVWDLRLQMLAVLGFDSDKPYPRDMESQIDPTNTTAKFLLEGDFRARCGHAKTTIAEWIDFLGEHSVLGLEDEITCPVLNMAGEGEFAPDKLEEERRHFVMLKNPKNKFNITTAAEGGEAHCTANNYLLKNQLEFDWLDEILG